MGGCLRKHKQSSDYDTTHLRSIKAILTQVPCFPSFICLLGADLRILFVYKGTFDLRSQNVCMDLNLDAGNNNYIDKSNCRNCCAIVFKNKEAHKAPGATVDDSHIII